MHAAIKQLVEGFKNFFARDELDKRTFRRLVEEGQSPRIALIACSDSRVDPSLTLGCDPGDLFVIRNVANIVPPCDQSGTHHGTSAALEFAVRHLKVEHIIVMGHAQCGGVLALVEDKPSVGSFIHDWVTLARPALEKARQQVEAGSCEDIVHCCELENVKHSVGNLMSFPWLRERVEDGSLQLHGWYFDMLGEQLMAYDAGRDEFQRLA